MFRSEMQTARHSPYGQESNPPDMTSSTPLLPVLPPCSTRSYLLTLLAFKKRGEEEGVDRMIISTCLFSDGSSFSPKLGQRRIIE